MFNYSLFISKPNVMCESPQEGGRKVYINGPDHITKVAAMAIYGKNSSPEPKVLYMYLKTWHAVSGTQALI